MKKNLGILKNGSTVDNIRIWRTWKGRQKYHTKNWKICTYKVRINTIGVGEYCTMDWINTVLGMWEYGRNYELGNMEGMKKLVGIG